jgi:hypothetical protein
VYNSMVEPSSPATPMSSRPPSSSASSASATRPAPVLGFESVMLVGTTLKEFREKAAAKAARDRAKAAASAQATLKAASAEREAAEAEAKREAARKAKAKREAAEAKAKREKARKAEAKREKARKAEAKRKKARKAEAKRKKARKAEAKREKARKAEREKAEAEDHVTETIPQLQALTLSAPQKQCYQQADSDCGHWAFRIGSEILLGRSFTSEEQADFHTWGCPEDGESSIQNLFAQFEGSISSLWGKFNLVTFPRRQGRHTKKDALLTVAEIGKKLKPGQNVLIFNMQNMTWQKKTNKYQNADGPGPGHYVCCYAQTKDNFIIHDSNVNFLAKKREYKGWTAPPPSTRDKNVYKEASCTHLLSKTLLRPQQDAYLKAYSDLTKIIAFQNKYKLFIMEIGVFSLKK